MKERNKSKFLACVAVLIGGFCVFTSAQTQPASTTQFKLLNSYLIVIPVTVNGAGPYEFLLDTGTNTTLVTVEFARQLRLRPIDRIELVTVAGSQIVPRARLESLTIGATTAKNVEALFSDLREVRAVNPEICGVLGMNFLAQFNYLINYRERRIEFENDAELENSLGGARLPLECHEGRALVFARSAKSRSWRLALDSGISNLLLFAADWRDLKLDWAQGESQRLLARTDVGSQGVWQKRLRSFQIGGANFYDLPVAVMEPKVAGEGRVEDGLLPTSLFQRIYFNHRKNFVMLNPNQYRER